MPDVTEQDAKRGDIRAFWDEQARKYGSAPAATNPDHYAKELELAALAGALDPTLDTLEAGCGNGYNLFRLSGILMGRLVGFDYSKAMIEAAQAARHAQPAPDRFEFRTSDVLGDLRPFGRFRQIFTDRCLINLPTLAQQLQALGNLADSLEPGGRLLLIESTQQGQEAINGLRERVGLAPIPYHWHNHYIDIEAFLAGTPKSLAHVRTEDFSSLYFVISRVFNAAMTPPGGSPDYMAEINRIASMLPSFGDNGPLKLFVFEKRD